MTESPEVQNAVRNANLDVKERLTRVMSAMTIDEELKMVNAQQTSEVEVKLQKPGMIVPEQDDEQKKARRTAILDWPRRHEFMESWRELRGPGGQSIAVRSRRIVGITRMGGE